MFSIIFCSIIFSISVASAADNTYYWDRTNGVSIAGFTTNWSSCSSSSAQNGYRVTSLGSAASSCTNGLLTRPNAGDLFLAIFPTAYSSDTQIRGMPNARFYLRSNSGSATYRFDLGYASMGTFTSLGNVTRTGVSTSGTTYTIDLSAISGMAPAGSNLSLKVSVTTSGGGRVYMGTNGGTSRSNSGRFYVNETVVATPPTPTYNVSITASPTSADMTAGSSSVYNIVVKNTGNTGGNYTLSVADSDMTNFNVSTLGTTTVQINSGSNATTTLTVKTKAGATTGGIDNTIVTVRSVENSAYTNSTQVSTTVRATPPAGTSPKIIVKANRYVVLDDPNSGTVASGSGFTTARSTWNTNYWSGESTTIRAAAIVMSGGGTKLPGVTVTFNLINPAGGSPVNIATLITDGEGAAYYSYDLNGKNYWGNWRIDASATTEGSNIANSSSFILNWWGCANCHGSESIGSFGTYTPKSYYTMGIDFHSNPREGDHEDAMRNNNCIECHMSYNGAPTFSSSDPNKQYSPDWHKGKVTCINCHINANVPGSRAEIAGCYDTAGCHPKKNTNVNSELSTSGYIVGGNYKSLYSNIPNSAKAHTATSVRCILCHDAGHDISKPYNVSSSSNTDTENEQCWTCHTQRPAHFGTTCTGCHSQNAHNISVSSGGPDCKACHDVGGSAPSLVNFSAANSSSSGHKNLNSGASATVNAENKKCWACHGDGNQPGGHPATYKTPIDCQNCHTGAGSYGAPVVAEHQQAGQDVITAVNCTQCHDNNGMYISGTGVGTVNHYVKDVTNTATSPYGHLGPINTSTCVLCHNGPYTNDPAWGTPVNISTLPGRHHTETLTSDCDICHKDASISTLANVDFHNAAIKAGAGGDNCVGCHAGNE